MNAGKPASLEFPVWGHFFARNELFEIFRRAFHACPSFFAEPEPEPELSMEIGESSRYRLVQWGTDPAYYGFIGYSGILIQIFWSLGIPSQYFLV